MTWCRRAAPVATAELRRRIGRVGFQLREVIPRIGAHGCLSLTSGFALDENVLSVQLTVLGALAVFTAVVDSRRWMADPGPRRSYRRRRTSGLAARRASGRRAAGRER